MKTFLKTMMMILLVSFFTTSVLGQPGVPHQFKGKVTLNGGSAPDGILIQVKIGASNIASTSTQGGNYGYAPHIFYIQDPNGTRDGDLVEFYIKDINNNDIKAGEFDFTNGESTTLDLTATGTFVKEVVSDNSGGSKKSSSSSSGPGSSSVSSDDNASDESSSSGNDDCSPQWQCSGWEECINGIQKRTCTDIDRCDNDSEKPIEQRTCALPSTPGDSDNLLDLKSDGKGIFSKITGLVIGNNGKPSVLAAVIVLALVGALGYYAYRKLR